jgi:hypothetical protein
MNLCYMFLCNRFKWFIIYINNKMLRHASKSNNNNNRNDQVKIYFPSIPIKSLQHALHGTPNSGKKQNQSKTQNKTQLDKYLSSENQKTTMYGTTCILEILNNEPYAVYPSDKMILTSSISMPAVVGSKKLQQIPLLVDYSNMKRSQTPSYQIPYDFKVHSCIVKKYKMNPKSNTSFIVEYKDDEVYDFYILAKLSVLHGLSVNHIELDNFIKEDIISFLLMLNLY